MKRKKNGKATEKGSAPNAPAFRLPAAPTGFELLDLEWSHMAPCADEVLDWLPKSADESWGDDIGMAAFIMALVDVVNAKRALAATISPTLQLLRYRDLRCKTRELADCVQLISAVLARRARTMHPAATSAQVLLLIRDQLRQGMEHFVDGLPGPDGGL